ncbi:hypothetical protein PBOI14_39780 [Pseudomonas sp. Boi14]|nr:hypothetical protein PBOI14_39780 [Pseudomonas sp. Boi14]
MTQALIKTPEQLALMREAGRLLAQVFTYLDGFVAPGLSTLELDAAVEHLIRHELKARPASKGQYNYPYCINTSINEVVCHGMPHPKAVLKDGDIINIDITLEKNGYIADSSKMYLIGTVGPKARRLVDTTFEAMWAAIKVVRPGARLGDIGHAIQAHAEAKGYSVVREYCGHGIGRQMHEEPQILHFGRPVPAWSCARAWSSPSSRCSTRAAPGFAGSRMAGPWSPATTASRPSGNTRWR